MTLDQKRKMNKAWTYEIDRTNFMEGTKTETAAIPKTHLFPIRDNKNVSNMIISFLDNKLIC